MKQRLPRGEASVLIGACSVRPPDDSAYLDLLHEATSLSWTSKLQIRKGLIADYGKLTTKPASFEDTAARNGRLGLLQTVDQAAASPCIMSGAEAESLLPDPRPQPLQTSDESPSRELAALIDQDHSGASTFKPHTPASPPAPQRRTIDNEEDGEGSRLEHLQSLMRSMSVSTTSRPATPQHACQILTETSNATPFCSVFHRTNQRLPSATPCSLRALARQPSSSTRHGSSPLMPIRPCVGVGRPATALTVDLSSPHCIECGDSLPNDVSLVPEHQDMSCMLGCVSSSHPCDEPPSDRHDAWTAQVKLALSSSVLYASLTPSDATAAAAAFRPPMRPGALAAPRPPRRRGSCVTAVAVAGGAMAASAASRRKSADEAMLLAHMSGECSSSSSRSSSSHAAATQSSILNEGVVAAARMKALQLRRSEESRREAAEAAAADAAVPVYVPQPRILRPQHNSLQPRLLTTPTGRDGKRADAQGTCLLAGELSGSSDLRGHGVMTECSNGCVLEQHLSTASSPRSLTASRRRTSSKVFAEMTPGQAPHPAPGGDSEAHALWSLSHSSSSRLGRGNANSSFHTPDGGCDDGVGGGDGGGGNGAWVSHPLVHSTPSATMMLAALPSGSLSPCGGSKAAVQHPLFNLPSCRSSFKRIERQEAGRSRRSSFSTPCDAFGSRLDPSVGGSSAVGPTSAPEGGGGSSSGLMSALPRSIARSKSSLRSSWEGSGPYVMSAVTTVCLPPPVVGTAKTSQSQPAGMYAVGDAAPPPPPPALVGDGVAVASAAAAAVLQEGACDPAAVIVRKPSRGKVMKMIHGLTRELNKLRLFG